MKTLLFAFLLLFSTVAYGKTEKIDAFIVSLIADCEIQGMQVWFPWGHESRENMQVASYMSQLFRRFPSKDVNENVTFVESMGSEAFGRDFTVEVITLDGDLSGCDSI